MVEFVKTLSGICSEYLHKMRSVITSLHCIGEMRAREMQLYHTNIFSRMFSCSVTAAHM